MNNLIAYLKTLGSENSKSVLDKTIHFATIITPDVSKAKSDAMLSVLNSYIKDINAGTRLESKRANNAPWHKEWHYKSYKKWNLHVWRLAGPEKEWQSQLEDFYKLQPVFAVINGIGESVWQPIHNFCETNKIPCLFPTTNIPGESNKNIYSIYFSKGSAIEAQALAKYLTTESRLEKNNYIVQVNEKDNKASQISSTILSDILTTSGVDRYHSYTIEKQKKYSIDSFWREVLIRKEPFDLVLWLESPEIKELAKHIHIAENLQKIYLLSEYADTIDDLPVHFDKITLIHRYALPSASSRHLLRLNIWVKIKKIKSKHTKVMANAYYAASITANAIKHMRNNLSREYLIEKIEHMVDSAAFHSVYPHLSLGPNQRYASKGCFILLASDYMSKKINTTSATWIVP